MYSWGAWHDSCLGELTRIQEPDFASESDLSTLLLLVRWKGSGRAVVRRKPGLGSKDAKGTELGKVMTQEREQSHLNPDVDVLLYAVIPFFNLQTFSGLTNLTNFLLAKTYNPLLPVF